MNNYAIYSWKQDETYRYDIKFEKGDLTQEKAKELAARYNKSNDTGRRYGAKKVSDKAAASGQAEKRLADLRQVFIDDAKSEYSTSKAHIEDMNGKKLRLTSEEGGPEVPASAFVAAVKDILKQNPTFEELQDWRWSNFVGVYHSDEHISVSSRTSMWSDYLEGNITLNGKEFPFKVSVNGDVNRL